MPILTGIMLVSVEPLLRPQANSLANLSYNLFGYFPSPLLYGFVCSMTGGRTSRWGMFGLMVMSILVPVTLILASLFKKEKKS